MSEYGKAWNNLGQVHRGELIQQPFVKKREVEQSHPDKGGNYGLGVARVLAVDYEEHYVTLRTVIGTEQEFDRVPIPLTYPGAGARHFLGSMPEVGDYCVVGWLPQQSQDKWGGSKTPVILNWIVPGVWPGRSWLALSSFEEEEHDGVSSRAKEDLSGGFERIRHKLRHIHPGNIVASSSQGSDLVLDESVMLANRRGNEFILRDSDQAAVLRALQHFIALAGTRTYSGMVQRDANRLPTTMVSDGYIWDGAIPALNGVPLHETDLPEDGVLPAGVLTPHPTLGKTYKADGGLTPPLYSYPNHLDPYVFLRNGGFVNEDGVATVPTNDAVYGGKVLYRVGPTSGNTVNSPQASSFVEHRVEVAHVSDGRLPVTEQTDGFDAERLPEGDATGTTSANRPYIEWVLGTVVGNDPYSDKGRKSYGFPLVTRVFDDLGGVSPWVGPASIAAEGKGTGTPVEDHAATLFRLTPPSGKLAPTWWSVNKKGQVRVNISGPTTGSGLDMAVAGDMRLAVGGDLELLLKGGIHFGTLSKNSLRLRSEQGPVVIYGGGSEESAESVLEGVFGTQGSNATSIPSVDIHARTNARLRAEKKVLIKGHEVETSAKNVGVNAGDLLSMSATKKISMSSEDIQVTTAGKRSDSFTGPKQLLPTNGALHERNYAPNFPGVVCEEVTYEFGDRKESFKLGNHSTSMLVGNMTYETDVGTWKARAFQNTMSMNAEGLDGQMMTGNVKLSATAGSATIKGSVGVQVETQGSVSVRANGSITLAAPGNGSDIGPVLCGGTREPFTNLPFSTWGLGAKSVLISV